MVDYLTYYYMSGTEPFRSLSALSESDALSIMKTQYDEFEGHILFERFKNPGQYLWDRRQTEQWVREAFIAKGGKPQEAYPISMVLGASKWIAKHAPDPERHGEIRIPLSAFQEEDVSFTYPDQHGLPMVWQGEAQ
jgi:hypothetical protein